MHSSLQPSNSAPARRAAWAVGVAPVVAVMAFALIVCDVIAVDLGFTLFVACIAWLVLELHRYQKSMDEDDNSFTGHPSLPELAGEVDSLHA
jgi:hypothetical protein